MVLIIIWILSALSLIIVAHIIPGFVIKSFWSALFAALVIGLINATIGFFLKILTLPISIITFGIFLLVINALMIKLSTVFVPGFEVHGFWSAFFGAIVLAILNMILKGLVFRY
ncbi:phage holin family protein [Desulfobacterota bacterium AH_259_B03_O07]|nr:phage holin family protein [Desulfobacterota bacterium AH_259_B03_O07]